MPLIDLNGLGYFKGKENAMVAGNYSASNTYAVGDYVYYSGTLYRCTTAITTAEAWTAAHWTAAKLAEDLTSQSEKIDKLKRDFATEQNAINTYGHGVIIPQLEVGAVNQNGKYTADNRYRTIDPLHLTPGTYYINSPDNVYVTEFSGSDYTGGQGATVWGGEGRNSFVVKATKPYIAFFGYPDPVSGGMPYIYIETPTIINNIKEEADSSSEKVGIIESTIPQSTTGIKQIARLGWKPYTAYYPPEQSVDSYKLAYDMGMRMLLADLRKTSDGVFVCIHDDTINDVARNNDGTTISETITVAGHTLAELNQYNYGIKKGYPNRGILTLEQFLQTCATLNCSPVLELKVWTTTEDVGKICLMVRKYGLQDSFVWMESQDSTISARTCPIIRTNLPNATIMIAGGNTPDVAVTVAANYSGADKKTAISCADLSTLTSTVISDCRTNNIDIAYFRIDSTDEMDTAYATEVFNEIKYWVSCEINIHDYLIEKL